MGLLLKQFQNLIWFMYNFLTASLSEIGFLFIYMSKIRILSLKSKFKIIANDILKYFFIIIIISEKIKIDILCELPAGQTIHMKCQFLFSWNTCIYTCIQMTLNISHC